MNNVEIKSLVKRHRLFNYEVAEAIGIAETTLCKWFRKPLTEEQQAKVLQAIKKLKEGAA